MFFMGKDAFKYLVTAEKALQTTVSVAKTTIVIRSVIVPMANMASNMVQLAMRGVGPITASKAFPAKLIEINQYLANEQRRVELQVEMAAARGQPVKLAQLESQLKTLEDANRRMSIWPLLEAGEFNTISEGLTEADAAITEGRLAEYISNIVDRVPAKLGTAGRYLAVTRDTALFQAMARATAYGDFIAKAILYDKLTKKDGIMAEEGSRKLHSQRGQTLWKICTEECSNQPAWGPAWVPFRASETD